MGLMSETITETTLETIKDNIPKSIEDNTTDNKRIIMHYHDLKPDLINSNQKKQDLTTHDFFKIAKNS